MEKMKQKKNNRQKTKDSWIVKTSWIVLILISFSACKTTKTILKSQQGSPNAVSQVIEKVQKVQPQYITANVSKLALELQMDDRVVNVSATCKIKKDSVIYLSIQPFLGIEMFKAELTTDSLKVIDKMNNRYYATDYSYFGRKFGVNVDFYSIQSILTAQLFCIGEKEIIANKCILQPLTTNGYSIDFENKNMKQTTQVSAQNIIQQVLLKAVNSDYQLQTIYSEYLLQNGVNFPQKIALQVSNQKTKATCNFSVLRVQFDTDLKFIPTRAGRLTPGNLDDLLKK